MQFSLDEIILWSFIIEVRVYMIEFFLSLSVKSLKWLLQLRVVVTPINNFNFKVCKELAQQYEEVTFEYPKLANLLTRMSKFYDSIMTELRPQPEYFRVAFYGRGFPAFLQNKVFIYRGRGFERLPDFQARMLDQVCFLYFITYSTHQFKSSCFKG